MIFEKHSVDFFLSDKLKQDHIEEKFGCIRGAGRAPDNPTLEQYGYRNRKIIVAKSGLIQVTKGNKRSRIWENIQVDIHTKKSYQKGLRKIVNDIAYTCITISLLIALSFLRSKSIYVYDHKFLWYKQVTS